jgi:hypothetical protein
MEEVGKENYFHVKVGLPNAGLDPAFDCNHVSNEELRSIFGERVPGKGYLFDGAKSGEVKARVLELYPAISQIPELPAGLFLPESFARAVVSEVFHRYPMNWAKYAEDRWRGKKIESGDELTVLYRTPDRNATYVEIVYKGLEAEIADAEKDFNTAVAAHSVGHERAVLMRQTAKPPLTDMDRYKLQIKLRCIEESIDSSEAKLQKWGAMRSVVEGFADETFMRFFEDEIHGEEQRILEAVEEVQRMKEVLTETSERDLAVAIEVEKRLSSAKQDAADKVRGLKENLRQLQIWSSTSMFRAPSPRIAAPTQNIDSITLTVQGCSLCNQGFPAMDLVTASCACPYHPWCAAVQTSLREHCARCGEHFAENWLNSFGFFKCEGTSMSRMCIDFQYC